MTDFDKRVRLAAFAFLTEQIRIHGEALPRALRARGVDFEGHRVRQP
jgi:hypothetical protein